VEKPVHGLFMLNKNDFIIVNEPIENRATKKALDEDTWMKDDGVNLINLPEDHFEAMVKSLYKFDKLQILIIWVRFFLEYTMPEVEKTFGLNLNKQRTIYRRYSMLCKKYLKDK